MPAFLYFALLCGTFSLINKILGNLFKYSFIGRLCLIIFLLGDGFTHLNVAMSITEETVGATQMQRNIIYFTGIVAVILAFGLLFSKSSKWSAGFFIVLIVIYATLDLIGIPLEAQIGLVPANKSGVFILLDYFVFIIWAFLFGIYFAKGDKLIG